MNAGQIKIDIEGINGGLITQAEKIIIDIKTWLNNNNDYINSMQNQDRTKGQSND